MDNDTNIATKGTPVIIGEFGTTFSTAQANYGLLDRVAMNWYDPTYIQALVNASNNP